MKWNSRKLFITLLSMALAAVAPIWVGDSAIYIAFVGFLAAVCGLYGYNANTATKNHLLQGREGPND